jgi:hypothetical protein
MKSVFFLGWLVGLVVPVKKNFVLPWLLQSAQYTIFFSSSYTISIPLSTSPSKLGRQPSWVACLLAFVFGYISLIPPMLVYGSIMPPVCIASPIADRGSALAINYD